MFPHKAVSCCDISGRDISRRDSLIFGSLASFGLLAGGARSAISATTDRDGTNRSFGKAKRAILIWLDGGPSHLEMFDPKPEAPAEVRGPLDVIRTKQPGVVFGQGMLQLAKRSDRFSVIRSMTSPVGEHNLATQYALSGHIPGGRASAPAFTLPASLLFSRRPPLPAHVAIPSFNLGGKAKLTGYLGDSVLPWSLGALPTDKQFTEKIWPTGSMDAERLARRRELLVSADFSDDNPLADAIDLLRNTESKRVFELEEESAATRKRYGGKSIGQSCLLARRLLESGVPMVTVNNKGWDTHERLHERLHAGYTGAKIPVGLIPSLDQAVAALLDDLQSSGLIDETLVIVMGEFGRTPKINTRGGRDHWPRAYSVMLAGAGIQQGVIYGSSDRVGENADENPVTPSDLVATLYQLFGIEPHARIQTPDGQQLSRVPEEARVVRGVLS